MQKVQFFTMDGDISPDGQKVIDYLEAQIADTDNDIAALNTLPGYVKHYYVNVMRLNEAGNGQQGMTKAQWLKEYTNSGAQSAWVDLRQAESLQEATDKADEATEQTNALAQQLEAVQQQLEEAVARINELESEPEPEPKAKPKRKTRKAKMIEAKEDDESAETEVTDGKPAEEETEDSEAEDASEEA